jgi:hypothetical protein
MIHDWIFSQELSNQGSDVIDYYRGLYTILCEETVYSITMIIFLPAFWYYSLKDVGAWVLRNTVMRLVKRH